MTKTLYSRNWRNSRGQLSQVFTFFVAIVIILAALFIGGKMIGIFTGTACDATDVDFQKQLRETMENGRVFGSRNDAQLNPPCDAVELCFVDAIEIGNEAFTGPHPVITNAIRSGVERNVFVIREAGVTDIAYDDRIVVSREPDEGGTDLYVCIPNTGTFSFRTEGYGRFVRVSG